MQETRPTFLNLDRAWKFWKRSPNEMYFMDLCVAAADNMGWGLELKDDETKIYVIYSSFDNWCLWSCYAMFCFGKVISALSGFMGCVYQYAVRLPH